MQPAPTKETSPTEEQAGAVASGSALSLWSVASGISSTKAGSRGTLASGTLRIIIPTSEAESSADEIEEMSVPASPRSSLSLRIWPLVPCITQSPVRSSTANG